MENGDIRDNQITASSQWDTHHGPANGRLNFTPYGGKKGGWSSSHNDPDQWLQVDFQRHTRVAGISTQGRSCYYCIQFVTRYTVSSSEDGKHFQNYTQGGKTKVLSLIFIQLQTFRGFYVSSVKINFFFYWGKIHA